MNFFFSHLPAAIDALACGILRAAANIRASACSAVVTVLPPGVFITTIPFLDAATLSTLSSPEPALPTTLSCEAASINSAVTFVALRMTRPEYSPMMAFSSSGLRPVLISTSRPASFRISTHFDEMLSLMSTFFILVFSLHSLTRRSTIMYRSVPCGRLYGTAIISSEFLGQPRRPFRV